MNATESLLDSRVNLHFHTVCLSKKQAVKRTTVNEVADFEDVDVPFIGEIYNSKGDFWTAVVKVDGNDTRFKLHTGAAVSIVSDRELWLKDQQLSNTQQILRGPAGTILSVIGTFNELSQGRMRFLGHIVDAQGVHADPEKTRAIAQFTDINQRLLIC